MYICRVHFSFAEFKTQLESEFSIITLKKLKFLIRVRLNIHILFLILKNKLLASKPNLQKTLLNTLNISKSLPRLLPATPRNIAKYLRKLYNLV